MFKRIVKYKNSSFKFLSTTWKKTKISIPVSFGRPDILSTLPEITESLEAVMGHIEPQFLNLGQELQSIYASAGNLAQITISAAKSIGGREDEKNFLSNIDKLAKQTLSDLQGYRYGIRDSLKNATISMEYLSKLGAICSVIEKTGMSLNVIGLNIAVESSRSNESGEMFAVFTEEIRQLSKNISAISQNILNDTNQTQKSQASAHNKILKGLETFGKVYDSAEKIVHFAVRDIFEIMELSIRVFEKSNQLSNEIYQQVGEVVVGIQFHDIARQKIEHIVMALKDVDRLINIDIKTNSSDKKIILGRAYKILGLQASQLREVITDICGAYEKCTNAFDSLGNQVEELVADVSVFESSDDTENKIRTKISDLQSGLEQLNQLLDQGNELEAQIKDTAEQVSNAASKLSEHIDQVRGISMELHLKALNAIVKSAKLQEEGWSLEILAQEVSKLSLQSDKFVSDVVEILQSLVSVSLDIDLGTFETSDNENEMSVSAAIHQTNVNYERFKKEASTALQNSQQLQSEILNTGSELVFLTELSDELNVYLNQLEDIIFKLKPWAEYADHEANDKIEQVAQRYTMASERHLHDSYLNKDNKNLPLPESDNSEIFFDDFNEDISINKKEDDLGDNVELF